MARSAAPASAELLPTRTVRTRATRSHDAAAESGTAESAAPESEAPESGVAVRLRSERRSDGAQWSQLRLSGRAHLEPWEPAIAEPWERAYARRRWRRVLAANRAAMRQHLAVPAAIEVDGRYAGQITLGGIVRGANQTAWIGYWVGAPFVGRGVATAAVALTVELAFAHLGLQRLEATVRPENAASIAVLENNGFRREGYLRRYLLMDGQRRDHLLYALLRNDWEQTSSAPLPQP